MYLDKYGDRVPAAHRKVMHAIEHCRDGTFGHALYRCDACGTTHHVLRSCGNRHCPTCQQHKVEQWLGRATPRCGKQASSPHAGNKTARPPGFA